MSILVEIKNRSRVHCRREASFRTCLIISQLSRRTIPWRPWRDYQLQFEQLMGWSKKGILMRRKDFPVRLMLRRKADLTPYTLHLTPNTLRLTSYTLLRSCYALQIAN